MRHTVGGAHSVVTLLAAIVSSIVRALNAALVGDEHRRAGVPGREETAPGVLRPTGRGDVQMDVAGQQAEHVHRREMPHRIGAVRMQHQLRLRGRAGGEIEQQRIVGVGFAVRRECRRRRQQFVVASSPAPGRRRRCGSGSCPCPSNLAVSPCGDDMPGTAALEPVGQIVWRQQRRRRDHHGAEFHRRQHDSHNGTTLPSISSTRSPRLTPRARRPLATRFDRSDSSANVRRAAPSPTMIRAGGRRFRRAPVRRRTSRAPS